MSCVCRNMFFLLVLAMIAISPSISSSSEPGKEHTLIFEMYKTWHVHAVNGMSQNEILFLHCKSGDNDLGIRNLTVGTEFDWKFKPQIFGKTLFWCYMASDHGHASFNVFWNDDDLFYRCAWKNCIWIAKDDGIYLKNIPQKYDEFRHKWEPGRLLDANSTVLLQLTQFNANSLSTKSPLNASSKNLNVYFLNDY
ncbi:S-protein homolog 1-like [Durio zibethinus]|uniref:S-protein homolog n=1 Tax=Durio zibethinus TaxID=66656 RepID=A0A6P5XJA0_DURZI|nr:S-protein homolog 1-like [Durio zibethinus]